MRAVKSWLSLSVAMRSITLVQCFIALSFLVVCSSICCAGTSFWSPSLSEYPQSTARGNSTSSQKSPGRVGNNEVELFTDDCIAVFSRRITPRSHKNGQDMLVPTALNCPPTTDSVMSECASCNCGVNVSFDWLSRASSNRKRCPSA